MKQIIILIIFILTQSFTISGIAAVSSFNNIWIYLILIFLLFTSVIINFRQKSIFRKQLLKVDDELDSKNNKIKRKQKEIEDSYSYARAVQVATLKQFTLDEYFPENFVFFKPKKIVSGDFYYFTKKEDKIIVAVADCTGQGVPGALLSTFGLSYLCEAVRKGENTDEILSDLREKFIRNLDEKTEESSTKYSMDIALCIIDYDKMEMQFSGAYSPLYLISNNNLEVFRGDRLPIGFSLKEDNYYTKHNVKINKGDILYLFTDGYCDQVGGDNRKKFMTKRFGHLLLDMYQFPLSKQKQWIKNTLNEWMGENDQVDDITVVGIKI